MKDTKGFFFGTKTFSLHALYRRAPCPRRPGRYGSAPSHPVTPPRCLAGALQQVRRHLMLLHGVYLAELINAGFPVIACCKPANTILVPNRQLIKDSEDAMP